MNLLALDTATRSCSVAVMIGDRLAAEVSTVTPRTHSAHLMHITGEALALAHLKPAEVDGFAVTVGPGSFTGLRIGLSTVKGLAFASGKPCIGVSGLEALAAGCPAYPHAICSLMDARKGQVYAAVFRRSGDRLMRIGQEKAASLEEVLAAAADGPCLFVGDGAALHAERIRSRLGDRAHIAGSELNYPRGGIVARIALALWADNPAAHATPLLPRYLRRSDVELGIRQSVAQTATPAV